MSRGAFWGLSCGESTTLRRAPGYVWMRHALGWRASCSGATGTFQSCNEQDRSPQASRPSVRRRGRDRDPRGLSLGSTAFVSFQSSDGRWHEQARAAMRDTYDAIWLNGFCTGVLLDMAAGAAVWVLGGSLPSRR